MRVRSCAALVAVVSVLSACRGADGPTGPAGPTGPPGLPGPVGAVSRFEATGTFGVAGTATIVLPPAATANGRLPLVSCYVSSNRNTWLQVAQVPTGDNPFCGLTSVSTTASVTFVSGLSGWFYAVVVGW